jgi:hypothetical protein
MGFRDIARRVNLLSIGLEKLSDHFQLLSMSYENYDVTDHRAEFYELLHMFLIHFLGKEFQKKQKNLKVFLKLGTEYFYSYY